MKKRKKNSLARGASGSSLWLVAALLVLLPACSQRAPRPPVQARSVAVPGAPVPAPDTVAAAAPSVRIGARPSTIERGTQTTLEWSSSHASSVRIDSGVGNVAQRGSLVVSPLKSTTYTATASGPGGVAKSSTRVTVVIRSRDADLAVTDIDNLERAIRDGRVRPIFFAYDKAQLSPQAKAILQENARWFKRFGGAAVIIEGHCDERGTEEYNLALGDRRAQAARDYLIHLGVPARQLEAISFGEERPFARGHDEAAWRLNRRAQFVVRQ